MSNFKKQLSPQWQQGVYNSQGNPYIEPESNHVGELECYFFTISTTDGIISFGMVQRVFLGSHAGSRSEFTAHIYTSNLKIKNKIFGDLEQAKAFVERVYENATDDQIREYTDKNKAIWFDRR